MKTFQWRDGFQETHLLLAKTQYNIVIWIVMKIMLERKMGVVIRRRILKVSEEVSSSAEEIKETWF